METKTSHRALAVRIAQEASDQERLALTRWGEAMLAIPRHKNKLMQAYDAVIISAKSGLIVPILKRIAAEIKKHSWDERSSLWRVGGLAAVVGFVVSAGGGAGIAALGTAIGVPVWVVFGAGAVWIKMLLDELNLAVRSSPTSSAFDAEFVERPTARDAYNKPSQGANDHDLPSTAEHLWVGSKSPTGSPYWVYDGRYQFAAADRVVLYSSQTGAVADYDRAQMKRELKTVSGSARDAAIAGYNAWLLRQPT